MVYCYINHFVQALNYICDEQENCLWNNEASLLTMKEIFSRKINMEVGFWTKIKWREANYAIIYSRALGPETSDGQIIKSTDTIKWVFGKSKFRVHLSPPYYLHEREGVHVVSQQVAINTTTPKLQNAFVLKM